VNGQFEYATTKRFDLRKIAVLKFAQFCLDTNETGIIELSGPFGERRSAILVLKFANEKMHVRILQQGYIYVTLLSNLRIADQRPTNVPPEVPEDLLVV